MKLDHKQNHFQRNLAYKVLNENYDLGKLMDLLIFSFKKVCSPKEWLDFANSLYTKQHKPLHGCV